MANLLDFFFEQLVQESDMDTLQGNLQAADHALMLDQVYTGIISEFAVTQQVIPDRTVQVSGPGRAYDQTGQRVFLASSTNLDLTTDSTGSSTDIVTPGNEKWVSVFIQFERVFSDLRFDGNGVPVNFRQDEGSSFVVVQGAEAALTTATKPALLSNALLIADVLTHRTGGVQDPIVDGGVADAPRIESRDIVAKPLSRFQFIFNLVATSPAQARVGPLPDAMQALLTELNNHINGVSNLHPATAISFDNTAVPADWVGLKTETEVQGALVEITTDLASTTPGTSGASNVGYDTTAIPAAWAIAKAGTDVAIVVDGITNDLGDSTATDGALLVGFDDTTTGAQGSEVHGALRDAASLSVVNNFTVDQRLVEAQVTVRNTSASGGTAGFERIFPSGTFNLTKFISRHAAVVRTSIGFTIIDSFDMSTAADRVMVLRIFGVTVDITTDNRQLSFIKNFAIHKSVGNNTVITEYGSSQEDTYVSPNSASFNVVGTGSENSIVELRFTTADSSDYHGIVVYEFLQPHNA